MVHIHVFIFLLLPFLHVWNFVVFSIVSTSLFVCLVVLEFLCICMHVRVSFVFLFSFCVLQCVLIVILFESLLLMMFSIELCMKIPNKWAIRTIIAGVVWDNVSNLNFLFVFHFLFSFLFDWFIIDRKYHNYMLYYKHSQTKFKWCQLIWFLYCA